MLVVEVQRVGVHGQQREPHVVGLGDGAAGPVLVDVADGEVVVAAADVLAIAAGGDLLAAVHGFLVTSVRRCRGSRRAPARPAPGGPGPRRSPTPGRRGPR